MKKTQRIALGSAVTLCVAAFLLGVVFLVGSLKGHNLYASAEDGVTEINLADYSAFRWTLKPYGNELDDGTVYHYQYLADESWHDYYTTSPRDSAPESEWSAWKQVSAVSAVRSIALLRSD
ncbi:MAG: hypothetical protein K2N74_02665, partial [Clostridiales bacterium]|nr:hypothetical protein [Clostridiales bacterium]